MDRMNEAAAGGRGRRRTSGDAAVTSAKAEGAALPSIAASAARARAGGRPRGGPVATAVRSARPARSASVSSYSERQRKRYAEDAGYREGVQARNRAYRAANREELNARARKAYAENDEYRARRRLSGNKWYRREERLKQVYGLSPQDYEAMVAQQGGVCRVCKTKPARPLFVDHCHASGRVRGLLCHPCNAALGFMRDDPVIAAAAAEYLREAKREEAR
jgi:Autographiviridae endonuclease VII